MAHEIKAILALLDQPADMAGILAWASRFARAYDATVDGVFLRHDWLNEIPTVSDGFGVYYTDIVARELQEAAERAEEEARKEFERAQKPETRRRFGALHAVSRASRDDLGRVARCYDLAMAHLPAENSRGAGEELLGQLLLRGGAPVLAVPKGAEPDAPLQSALVAWDGSLEASRALRAAFPLLRDCAQVHLRTVYEKADERADTAQIRRYLELHGVNALPGHVKAEGGSVAETLLAEAETLGAHFLVMGAFGNAPWQEQLFGGVSHEILRKARKPVFFSH